jgi:hypothetical protein
MIFEIKDSEIARWPDIYEQSVLVILKEKGAPIEGIFWLKVKKDYIVAQTRDNLRGITFFTFEKQETKHQSDSGRGYPNDFRDI